MAIKDFYIVLGIPRDATPRGIGNAYLRLAKQSHPDRLGESGKEALQDIQDAYETLSDPEKRSHYNRSLDDYERRVASMRARKPGFVVSEPISKPPLGRFGWNQRHGWSLVPDFGQNPTLNSAGEASLA